MHAQIRLLSSLFVLAPLLFACGTTSPTRFYVLSTVADKPAEAQASTAIGVGPINLPQYLDRPQIVTRLSSNQLAVGEFDQWGGQLDDGFARTLAGNLSRLLGTDQVQLYPWKDEASLTYAVTVDVINFEQDVDGSSLLDVYWSLLDAPTGRVKLRRHATYRDPGGAPITDAEAHSQGGLLGDSKKRPYDNVVAAMSRNLGALSRDIAKAIQSGG
jgi:uncharacterized lipoprotein YmbA